MLLGISSLVLAVLISISGFLGDEQANLRATWETDVPTHKIPFFYWAVLFYNYTGILLTGIIFLVVSILIPLSHYSEVTKETKSLAFTSAAAIGMSLVALTIAVYSAFSLIFVSYHHVSSAEFDGDKYNLGLISSLGSDSFVVIGKCDRFNIRCDCYGVSRLDTGEYDETSATASLERDVKTQIIYINTQSSTMPIDCQP
ncbi:MAG: hypothetical protein EAZ83_08365 [Oscillatoriales cyanobacterium]|nr:MULTISPECIES: hypothetical protein [unclassified Microcoleus]MCC3527970.1 hypothetical protein [Microcoleus sp. PH2017_21_RUC_O_A]MCC3539936.1 hypothetical protein [Microcoleus sp. PH2017_22_RUC_O_B]TAE83725.1 MAG: hypothetical protein EAZ83_08365 [Oscillatoriales cyanobacterium]